MDINLKNPKTEQIIKTKVGFSWTTLFFGFWPALFRGDWFWFFIEILIEIVTGTFTIGGGILGCQIVFAFLYNGLYIKQLLKNGWVPANETSKAILFNKGYITQ